MDTSWIIPVINKNFSEIIEYDNYKYDIKIDTNAKVNYLDISIFDDEAWKPITITKGQSANIIGIAPSPDAIDFRVELNQYK
jgi:hypothetical protein